MALKVLVHYFNSNNDSVVYNGVETYSYDAGVLSLTQAAVPPATGTTSTTVNAYEGVMRIEIFPEVTQFPGDSVGTPSG